MQIIEAFTGLQCAEYDAMCSHCLRYMQAASPLDDASPLLHDGKVHSPSLQPTSLPIPLCSSSFFSLLSSTSTTSNCTKTRQLQGDNQIYISIDISFVKAQQPLAVIWLSRPVEPASACMTEEDKVVSKKSQPPALNSSGYIQQTAIDVSKLRSRPKEY